MSGKTLERLVPESNSEWLSRLGLIVTIGILHVGCYYWVNRVNSLRPASAYWNLGTEIDAWIPYLSWTWPFYYSAHLFVTLWAGMVLLLLSRDAFKRAILAYAAMIVVAAAVQLAVPAQAPWPASPGKVQLAMHQALAMRPYACLPSMHVALSILPAGIGLYSLKSPLLKGLAIFIAASITISTLTMKEHYFWDSVTGLVLGLLAFWYWHAGRGSEFAL